MVGQPLARRAPDDLLLPDAEFCQTGSCALVPHPYGSAITAGSCKLQMIGAKNLTMPHSGKSFVVELARAKVSAKFLWLSRDFGSYYRNPGVQKVSAIMPGWKLYGFTSVITETELLSGRTSRSLLRTCVVLVNKPACVGTTVIVMSAVAPCEKEPKVNFTTPLVCVQLPRLVVALTNVTLDESASVTLTPVPSHSPLWFTRRE